MTNYGWDFYLSNSLTLFSYCYMSESIVYHCCCYEYCKSNLLLLYIEEVDKWVWPTTVDCLDFNEDLDAERKIVSPGSYEGGFYFGGVGWAVNFDLLMYCKLFDFDEVVLLLGYFKMFWEESTNF